MADDVDRTEATLAAQKFFNTTELLENALLFLPLRDLLQAQRISKYVKTLFDSSSAIQKALFFEPLAMKSINGTTDQEHTYHVSDATPEEVYPKPPLKKHLGLLVTIGLYGGLQLDFCQTQRFTVNTEVCRSPSWQRMLVVQPHTLPLFVFRLITTPYPETSKRGVLMEITRLGTFMNSSSMGEG